MYKSVFLIFHIIFKNQKCHTIQNSSCRTYHENTKSITCLGKKMTNCCSVSHDYIWSNSITILPSKSREAVRLGWKFAGNPLCFCKSQFITNETTSQSLPTVRFHLIQKIQNKEAGKLKRGQERGRVLEFQVWLKEEECWNFRWGWKSRLRNKYKCCYPQKLENNPIHATPLGVSPLVPRVGRKVKFNWIPIKQLKCKWALFRWIWTTEMVVPGLLVASGA